MTTTHTQPAGCDLDSLTRYDHRGALMVPDQTGDYFLVPDVREAAARAAQAPTGLQDEQGLADAGLDYLLQYIPVPAARVAAQCKVAELRAAQAPQGDTRQGAPGECPFCGSEPDTRGGAHGKVMKCLTKNCAASHVYVDESAWRRRVSPRSQHLKNIISCLDAGDLDSLVNAVNDAKVSTK